MNKRVLIIGAHGFIGRALGGFITKNWPEARLFGISRHTEAGDKNVFVCDVNETVKLENTLIKIKPHYVYNLAGGRIQDEQELFKNNFLATKSLLQAVKKNKLLRPRIIIPGTAAEYGPPKAGIKKIPETYWPQPASWYGFVKLLQTKLSLQYAQEGTDVVVARMFNILGEGTPAALALGRFSQQIVLMERGEKKPVLETQRLDGRRDFLDIQDVCRALIKIAQDGQSKEVYNVCSGESYIVRNLLKTLLKFSTVKNIAINEDPAFKGQSFDVIGSNAKIKKDLKWSPEVSIEQSLENTLNYYRETL